MKHLPLFIALVSLLAAAPASAQGMMGWRGSNYINQPVQSAEIDAAVQEIDASQNISDASKITCSKVTDAQFEKLGDAYMGYAHPGQEHDYVEQMMGGEGSATLRLAHINMGRAYLGCWSNYNAAPYYMPMMGRYGTTFRPFMMGGYVGSSGWLWTTTIVLSWALIILCIVACVKYLRKK